MQKQKKIQISEALPSVMTKTLGKANTICRVFSPRHSAKDFFKNTKYCLKNVCRVSYSATLDICLSFAERSTRRKGILKTKKYF